MRRDGAFHASTDPSAQFRHPTRDDEADAVRPPVCRIPAAALGTGAMAARPDGELAQPERDLSLVLERVQLCDVL